MKMRAYFLSQGSFFMIWASILLIPLPAICAAEDLVVVVNDRNPDSLKLDDIRSIYLDRVGIWSNRSRVRVYNLPVGQQLRERFSRVVLGMSAQEAAKVLYNRKITNTLRNAQHTRDSRVVMYRLCRQVNAIGYLPASLAAKCGRLRVVMRIPEGMTPVGYSR